MNTFGRILNWLFYVIGYILTLFVVDLLFESFFVDDVLYYFLSAILLCLLNKTLKPILFKLTIPITGITFGLFYFVINFFIIELVNLILGNHFQIYGIWMGLFITLAISLIHFFIKEVIIKPIIRRCEKDD